MASQIRALLMVFVFLASAIGCMFSPKITPFSNKPTPNPEAELVVLNYYDSMNKKDFENLKFLFQPNARCIDIDEGSTIEKWIKNDEAWAIRDPSIRYKVLHLISDRNSVRAVTLRTSKELGKVKFEQTFEFSNHKISRLISGPAPK